MVARMALVRSGGGASRLERLPSRGVAFPRLRGVYKD
jgi:hypothetical protein